MTDLHKLFQETFKTYHDAAKRYFVDGWLICAVKVRDKEPILVDAGGPVANEPALWSTDPYMYTTLPRNTSYNIGLLTGKRNNFWVLDVDGQRGQNSLEWLKKVIGPRFCNTLSVTTGRGQHFYFEIDCNCHIPPTCINILPGIDVRGEKGMVVVPPSIHSSGKKYEANSAPMDGAPEILLDLVCNAEETVIVPGLTDGYGRPIQPLQQQVKKAVVRHDVTTEV